MKKLVVYILCLMLALCALCGCTSSGSSPATADGCIGQHHTIEVNGVSIYYEQAGSGKPVILCHGNGGSHKDLSCEIEQLVNAGYEVYALDSRGQGANERLDEYHYTDMAEDVYQFIQTLGLDHPAFYGWSDGGIVGLELEIAHPGCTSALAVSGANLNPEALNGTFGLVTGASSALTGDPLYDMILTEPDITCEQLASITVPTLVTAGTDDIVSREHTELIASSIPGAQLMIFSGESHGSYIQGSQKMGDALIAFLQECGY